MEPAGNRNIKKFGGMTHEMQVSARPPAGAGPVPGTGRLRKPGRAAAAGRAMMFLKNIKVIKILLMLSEN